MARTLLYDPGMVGLPSVLVPKPNARVRVARGRRARRRRPRGRARCVAPARLGRAASDWLVD